MKLSEDLKASRPMSDVVVSPEAYDALVKAGFVSNGKMVAYTKSQVALQRMKAWLRKTTNE